MIKNLGVDFLAYPEIIVSDEIVQYLRFSGILKSVNFVSGKTILFSFKIKDCSELPQMLLNGLNNMVVLVIFLFLIFFIIKFTQIFRCLFCILIFKGASDENLS